ncbi:MAG: DUF4357 domain-containing protein [Chryseobacterium sp.]|nr:MAG: DUF4357 domain-containing protein [Chryseobacterium sp.]
MKDDQKNEIKKQGKMIDFVEVSTDKRNTEINAEYYNERKIVLKTGSKLSKEVVSTYKQKAARNRELKKIATETDEHWVLKEDKAFSSVSGAINYATGGSMNGWEYWIITESGAALQSIRK